MRLPSGESRASARSGLSNRSRRGMRGGIVESWQVMAVVRPMRTPLPCAVTAGVPTLGMPLSDEESGMRTHAHTHRGCEVPR